MNKKILIFSTIVALCSSNVFANWEYDGYYTKEGHYIDNGARFVVGIHGGMSYGIANMKNKVGSLDVYGEEETPIYNVASLPVAENYSKFGFAANASIGFVLPEYSNWRIEAGWDKIAKTEYNQIPLFSGKAEVYGVEQQLNSGGVASSVSTDIISAMVYYDFFDGDVKTAHSLVPYIGFGVGYANSRTTLKLSDIYGDLANFGAGYDSDLLNYGYTESASGDVIHFYESTVDNANVSILGSAGLAYGLTDSIFLDLNAKVIYLPEVKWKLSNEAGTQYRDWFSAENMINMNLTLGLRFEF